MYNFTFQIPAGVNPGACCEENARARFTAMTSLAVFPIRSATEENPKVVNLISTNGKILSVLPTPFDGELLAPVLLPSGLKGNGTGASVAVNGEVHLIKGRGKSMKVEALALPEQSGRFPCIRDVFPSTDELSHYRILILDAKQFASLASAISETGKLVLFIQPATEKEPITVTKPVVAVGLSDIGPAQGYGLLMPFSIPGNETPSRYVEWMRQRLAELPIESHRFDPEPVSKPETETAV